MNRQVYQNLLKMNNAKNAYISARKVYCNELMAIIQKYGEIEIDDEDEGNPETGDFSKRIATMDESYTHLYSPTFDKVRVVNDSDGKHMEFHVKNGDGLFDNNSWVSAKDFIDDAWKELIDYIDFRTI